MKLSEIVRKIDGLTNRDKETLGRALDFMQNGVDTMSGTINAAISTVDMPAGIPVGGIFIGMFKDACPAGWTRLTALDDKFPRGASSYGGTGGSSTHSHTGGGTAHTHSVGGHTHTMRNTALGGGGSLSFMGISGNSQLTGLGGSGYTGSGGGATISTSSHTPPYVDVVFCIKD